MASATVRTVYTVYLSLTHPFTGREVEGELRQAATLREASEVLRGYVNGDNPTGAPVGASQVGRNCGRVTVAVSGAEVARVSYNGRVWEPGAYPTQEVTELDR
jgi:hypothetical protein